MLLMERKGEGSFSILDRVFVNLFIYSYVAAEEASPIRVWRICKCKGAGSLHIRMFPVYVLIRACNGVSFLFSNVMISRRVNKDYKLLSRWYKISQSQPTFTSPTTWGASREVSNGSFCRWVFPDHHEGTGRNNEVSICNWQLTNWFYTTSKFANERKSPMRYFQIVAGGAYEMIYLEYQIGQ